MFAALLTMALVPAAAVAQEWRTYSYPESGFTIQFPGDPEVQTARVRNSSGLSLPVTRYTAGHDGLMCSLSVVNYANTSADSLSTIAETERSLGATGKVTAEAGARINRVFGRALEIVGTDGSHSAIAIFFFDRHLYTVTGQALPPNAAGRSGEATRCRDSLQFLDNDGGLGGFFGGGGKPHARASAGNPTTDAACAGKSLGDAVQLQTPGGPVHATCTLVARPDLPSSGPQAPAP
jgi:hypothetical protein